MQRMPPASGTTCSSLHSQKGKQPRRLFTYSLARSLTFKAFQTIFKLIAP